MKVREHDVADVDLSQASRREASSDSATEIVDDPKVVDLEQNGGRGAVAFQATGTRAEENET